MNFVDVPERFVKPFKVAEDYVKKYFNKLKFKPEDGLIEIDGERYILLRASSMSISFLEHISNMYPGISDGAAIKASSKVLFDMAKSFGQSDAKEFHKKLGVTDPIEKLSTGPVHFAFSGWANVDISPDSSPSMDEDYYLLYDHPHSFEADTWIKERGQADFCTCFMNAGYSSGWCQESFGIKLESVEITCRAKGDDQCRFIMAQPHRLKEFVASYKESHPEIFKSQKNE